MIIPATTTDGGSVPCIDRVHFLFFHGLLLRTNNKQQPDNAPSTVVQDAPKGETVI